MQTEDLLVSQAAKNKWLLPPSILVLSLLALSYYYDSAIAFSWFWGTSALAVFWLTLECHTRVSAIPDHPVFLASAVALGLANHAIGIKPIDNLVFTVINAVQIYLATYLFSTVINKGCSLTDGRAFAHKVLKVSGKLCLIMTIGSLAIAGYLSSSYNLSLGYETGAIIASSLTAYIFVFPVLLSVCNKEPKHKSSLPVIGFIVLFAVFTSVTHLVEKPLFYDLLSLSVWLIIVALSLRLREFSLVGLMFILIELIYLHHELNMGELDPLQVNLALSVIVGISAAASITTTRARILHRVAEQTLTRLKGQTRQLELSLKSASISMLELDIGKGEATLLEGNLSSLPKHSKIMIEDNLTALIPSEADAQRVRNVLDQDNSHTTYAVHEGTDATQRGWYSIYTGETYSFDGRDKRLILIQDVTELNKNAEQLREASERQKELFSVISHELRTPVAAISMVTDEADLSASDKLNTIRDISDNLLSVLEDLRSVVVPERARTAKERIAKPAAVVARAINTVLPLAQEHSVKIHSKLDSYESVYQFREQAVRQLVTNLIKNAILHADGANIWVNLNYTESDDNAVSVSVRVEDDGKGIAKDQIERMFGAFSRGNTNKDGTGLGLYISRELVQDLDGVLSYTDSEQGGACFTACFPLTRVDAKTQTQIQTHPNFEGMRILFAEDDRMLRMLTTKVFEKKGALVSGFENGKLAFDAYKPEDFDLILTDIMMPEMDGQALTIALRESGCQLPIIGVTAAVVGRETEQLLAAGADGCIAKPLTIDGLSAELMRINSPLIPA